VGENSSLIARAVRKIIILADNKGRGMPVTGTVTTELLSKESTKIGD
jgi:hypothetical protein